MHFSLSQSAKSKAPYERDSDRTLVDSESDPAPRGNRRLTARISQYIHFGSAVWVGIGQWFNYRSMLTQDFHKFGGCDLQM